MTDKKEDDDPTSNGDDTKRIVLPRSGLARDIVEAHKSPGSSAFDSLPSQSSPGPPQPSILAFAAEYDRPQASEEADESSHSLGTWVTFALETGTYALPVSHVHEILRVGSITRVPQAPRAIRGITNVRGRVIPVADLRVLLDFAPTETGPRSRILFATVGATSVGLLVDSVDQVMNLNSRDVEPAPPEIRTEKSDYITGVARKAEILVILLEAEQLLRWQSRADAANPACISREREGHHDKGEN